jgi:hypothetical protein
VLVKRGPDPDDARAVRGSLMPDGADALEQAARARTAVMAEWVAPDTPFFVGAAAVAAALLVLPAGRRHMIEAPEVEADVPVARRARRSRITPTGR